MAATPLVPMAADVFFSTNRQSVKLLKWDNDGFLLYRKRLERGIFEMHRKTADTNYYEFSYETFSLSRREVSSSSTSSILGRADFKFSGIALLNW